MSGYVAQATDGVEPVSDSVWEIASNLAIYNVVNAQGGACALTYDAADMTVDLAAGVITHFGALVTISALANAFTLVSDPSNPRWTWLCLSSAGTATVVSGSPAAVPAVPELGDNVALALVYVQAGLTVAASAAYKIDKRIPAVSQQITKYKSAVQTRTTDTSLVDVIAVGTPATFSFAIGASEVWECEYWIPLTFGGTGGAKFQISGPAAPTNVDITGLWGAYASFDGVNPTNGVGASMFSPVTSFAANIAAFSSVSTGGSAYSNYDALHGSFIQIHLRVINGANAGTVTLQVGQNSSNSTTTLGIGSIMNARRVA